jgi:hypothetical protein
MWKESDGVDCLKVERGMSFLFAAAGSSSCVHIAFVVAHRPGSNYSIENRTTYIRFFRSCISCEFPNNTRCVGGRS